MLERRAAACGRRLPFPHRQRRSVDPKTGVAVASPGASRNRRYSPRHQTAEHSRRRYEADGYGRGSAVRSGEKGKPLTLLATAAGTLAFKPPESRRAQGDSCAADVWAIGATLYLLLTDRLPFEMPADVSWGKQICSLNRCRRHRRPNPDVNHALDSIVMKTLEKADSRYRQPRNLTALEV